MGATGLRRAIFRGASGVAMNAVMPKSSDGGVALAEPATSSDGAASATILRLDASTVSSILDRFQDPSLLAQGRVNVLCVDAIRDRLGLRWEIRQELVYDHVQEVVERRLGPSAVSIRVAETLFAVVQPDAERLTAQALCLRCLRDIHHHFLGHADVADLTLHEVTRIAADGLFGSRVDMAALAAAEARLPETVVIRGPSEPQPRKQVDQWTPFVAANGRMVRASCTLEPLVHLTSSACIGYRLGRRVIELPSETALSPSEQQNLSRADIARIDYATLARGLDRLATEGGNEQSPTLMIPVSFVTLSNQRTREVFVQLLNGARDQVRHGLICEVSDLDGVPAGALLATIALIKPFCVRVVGSITGMSAASSKRLREVGLHGLTAECPRNLGEAEFIGWLKEARSSSQLVSNTVFACRVEGMRRAGIAGLAGMSHATLTTDAARTMAVA